MGLGSRLGVRNEVNEEQQGFAGAALGSSFVVTTRCDLRACSAQQHCP